MLKLKQRLFSFFTSLVLVLTTACSSSLFDSKKDDRIIELTANNVFVTQCKGVSLGNETLDVPTARNLIACLDENGAIREFHLLVNALTDRQVQSLLDVINKGILTNKARLKALDLTFTLLDQLHVLDDALNALADVMSNKELINGALVLIHDLGFEIVDGNERINPDIIKAIAALGPDITRENMESTLDSLTYSAGHRAFDSLADELTHHNPKLTDQELRLITDSLYDFLVQESRVQKRNLTQVLLKAMAEGHLFTAFDKYYSFNGSAYSEHPGDSAHFELDYQMAGLNLFFNLLAGKEPGSERFMENMAGLFGSLNGPIACLEDDQRISNAIMWVVDEITKSSMPIEAVPRFLSKTSLLTLASTNSLCMLPASVGQNIGALFQLVETGAARVSGELLKSIRASDPTEKELLKLVVDIIGNPNLTKVKPVLTVFQDRHTTIDAMYLLNALNPSIDRTRIQNLMKILNKSQPTLGGKTVVDVFIERLAQMPLDSAGNKQTLFEVAKAFSNYFDESLFPNPIVKPAMSVLRRALLHNNLSPVVELVQEIALDAEKDQEFFTTIFQASKLPQFQGALDLTVKMSRDKSMKELISALLSMFRNSVSPVVVDHRPQPIIPDVRLPIGERDRAVANMPVPPGYVPPRFELPLDNQGLGCSTVDVNLAITDVQNPRWANQVRSMVACLNNGTSNEYADWVSLVNYGFSHTVPALAGETAGGRKNLLQYLVDLVSTYLPATERVARLEFGDFVETHSDELKKTLVLNQLFLEKRNINGSQLSMIEELLKVAPRLAQKEPWLRRLMAFAGNANDLPETPKALGFLSKKYFDEDPLPENRERVAMPSRAEVRAMIERLSKKTNDPDIEAKISEVYTDYATLLRNDVRRFSYDDFETLNTEIGKFLEPLSRPHVLEWTLEFFKKFRGNPYTADWWAGWYKRLAENYSVIPYYYDGESKPRTRIVSDLDKLELVVVNADFTLRDYCSGHGFILCILPNGKENFSIKFLSYLAKSGNDLWPAIDAMEKELEFYISVLNNSVLGATLPQEVKNRLRNLEQSLPVIRKLYTAGGRARASDPNDMQVLADMFHYVLNGTRRDDRDEYKKNKNSLEFIVQLTSLGVLRNLGRSMQEVHPETAEALVVPGHEIAPVLNTVIEATLKAGTSGEVVNEDLIYIVGFLIRTTKGRALRDSILRTVYSWTATADSKSLLAKNSFYFMSEFGRMYDSGRRNGGYHLAHDLMTVLRTAILEYPQVLEGSFDIFDLILLDEKIAEILERSSRSDAGSAGFKSLAKVMGYSLKQIKDEGLTHDLMGLLNHVYLYEPTRANLHNVRVLWNDLSEDERYKTLHISDLFRRFFLWFEEEGNDSGRHALAVQTQRFLSENLKNGELVRLLLFAGCKNSSDPQCSPTQLYNQLSLLGREQRVVELQRFIDFLKNAMSYEINVSH